LHHSTEEPCDAVKVFPLSYDFPSFDIAAVFVYYETFQIFLYGILMDIELCSRSTRRIDTDGSSIDIRDLTSKSLDCVDQICQSIEYFFDGSTRITGCMVMLCPFQAVNSLLAGLMQAGTGDEQQDAAIQKKMEFVRMVQNVSELPVWEGPTLSNARQ
jgi:hypothetical protein